MLDLQPPSSMSKTDLFEYEGKPARKCINNQHFFMHVVGLLERTFPNTVVPVLLSFYTCVYSFRSSLSF